MLPYALRASGNREFLPTFAAGIGRQIAGGGSPLVCKLKHRGCSPDAITAFGKADRTFRAVAFRGCEFGKYLISGL